MRKFLMSTLAISAIATSVNAGCYSTGCADVRIDKILITTRGDILVGTTGNERSMACAATVGQYMTVPVNNPGKNALYSMFLTAKTTKAKVSMTIIKNTAGCKISYAYMK